MLDMRTDLEGNHQVQRSEVSYNHPQFVGPVLAPGARLGPAWARNRVGTRDSLQSFDAPRHRSQTQGEEHMNRDDILRMAREVSNTPIDHHATPDLFGVAQIERFAALVAAAEREACAKVCDGLERANLYGVRECANAIRARSST